MGIVRTVLLGQVCIGIALAIAAGGGCGGSTDNNVGGNNNGDGGMNNGDGSSSGGDGSSSGSDGSSTGNDGSSGGDGSSSGGDSGSMGTIACGNGMTCNAATEVCCATGQGMTSCTPAGQCQGLPIACESAANCSNGEVCCGSFMGGGGGAMCAASCGMGEIQLCAMSTECKT